MASEEHEEVSVSTRIPADLDGWLEEQAAARGLDTDEFVRELLAAHRYVSEGDADAVDAAAGDADGVPPAVADRLDDHREEFRDLLADVRKRVVQVKRETDEKAPADHEHEDLAGDVDAVAADLDALESTVADLETDLDRGFENYRDVLTYLTDATEALEDRMDVLARAVLDARHELREQAAREVARREAERLQLAANREGIRSAVCEECETSVQIGLLSAPECPHCASTFTDVEGKTGFFGSDRLRTGDPPALHGDVAADLDDSLDEMVAEGDSPGAPPEWDDSEEDADGEDASNATEAGDRS